MGDKTATIGDTITLEEAIELLESDDFKTLQNIRIVGVMGMASFTENSEILHTEFRHLRSIFDELKNNYFSQHNSFSEISMGMSGDYELAITCGSNMVRIGSNIFGARHYTN